MNNIPQQGLLVAHYGETVVVETPDRKHVRCNIRQNLGALAAGDQVLWQQEAHNTAVVLEVLPRKSGFYRQGFRGEMKLMAANCDLIMIVMAIKPRFALFNLDRFIVACEYSRVRPMIVLNKSDLLDETERAHMEAQLAIYSVLGYKVFYTSVVKNRGIDILREYISNHVSLVMGQSGVGKSSLLNALLPDLALQIGELSEHSGLGQHTTTSSFLYHLSGEGCVIDSPGFREFTLPPLSRAVIEDCFIDLKPFLGQCQFRNCSHHHEKSCAILRAVECGDLSASRVESFMRMTLKGESG